MEIGVDASIPTYSGGLGVLAGDTIRAAADLGLSMVGVTLVHRKGYFRQHLDVSGNQCETACEWSPEKSLTPVPARVIITIEGRPVQVRAWRYLVYGESGHSIPVYLLDTALPENSAWDQTLTDYLYQGDERYRLCQEAVLGLGGVAMLRALGYKDIQAYHMNEGHSTLIALALMEEQTWGRELAAATPQDRDAVRQRCIFTTHTPVAAGHDRFYLGLVRQVLGNERTNYLVSSGACPDGSLNMTSLALAFSRYVNGVSMRHEEISRAMFSKPIDSVTNGVHALTWMSVPFRRLFDHHIPEWRRDNLYLRYAISIPPEQVWAAHKEAKRDLLGEVERRTGIRLDPEAMTLGFARRSTGYKRTDLLFQDIERLKRIAREVGPIQVICGGKAHPRDDSGRALIRRIFQAASELKDFVPVVYLEEYEMNLAKYVCSGVDLWLNTPLKPYEASGTSGMKAALNGIPSLSVLDGWWIEGHIEGVTGWSIGNGWHTENADTEIASLYDKLENLIVPMFYRKPGEFTRIMRSAIALNGSYFNSQRMMMQYLQNAYLRVGTPNGHKQG